MNLNQHLKQNEILACASFSGQVMVSFTKKRLRVFFEGLKVFENTNKSEDQRTDIDEF